MNRTPDNWGIYKLVFLFLDKKTYVVGTQKNSLFWAPKTYV